MYSSKRDGLSERTFDNVSIVLEKCEALWLESLGAQKSLGALKRVSNRGVKRSRSCALFDPFRLAKK